MPKKLKASIKSNEVRVRTVVAAPLPGPPTWGIVTPPGTTSAKLGLLRTVETGVPMEAAWFIRSV